MFGEFCVWFLLRSLPVCWGWVGACVFMFFGCFLGVLLWFGFGGCFLFGSG